MWSCPKRCLNCWRRPLQSWTIQTSQTSKEIGKDSLSSDKFKDSSTIFLWHNFCHLLLEYWPQVTVFPTLFYLNVQPRFQSSSVAHDISRQKIKIQFEINFLMSSSLIQAFVPQSDAYNYNYSASNTFLGAPRGGNYLNVHYGSIQNRIPAWPIVYPWLPTQCWPS